MTVRKGTYKIRAVVRQVYAYNKRSKAQPIRLWDVLECGHATWFRPPETTREAVRMILSQDKPRNRRCYACVSGDTGYAQDIDWNTAIEVDE